MIHSASHNVVTLLFCFVFVGWILMFVSWSGLESSFVKHPVVWLLCNLHCLAKLLVASFLKELHIDWEGLTLLRWWLCLNHPKLQIVTFRIPNFCIAWWWLPSCFSLSQPWRAVSHSGPSFFLLPTPCSQSSGLPRLISCLAGSASLCCTQGLFSVFLLQTTTLNQSPEGCPSKY